MKNEELKVIGRRLQLVRKKIHLLQKELAEELGISGASLSEMESGNSKPRYELLAHLSKKYNVNIYYLLHGEGQMFLPEDVEEVARSHNYGPDTLDWIKNFLHYFDKSQFLRYAMMSYFSKFYLENKEAIELEIKENEQG